MEFEEPIKELLDGEANLMIDKIQESIEKDTFLEFGTVETNYHFSILFWKLSIDLILSCMIMYGQKDRWCIWNCYYWPFGYF